VPHRIALALTCAASLWAVVLVAAPVTLKESALTVPTASIYALSSRICHQRFDRSFHIGGIQMPVCARCFGLYLAGALGAVIAWGAWGSHHRDGARTRIALALAAVPTALTWGAEMAGLTAFSNFARALAALPLGGVAGWVFVQMLRYDSSLDGHEVHDRRSRVHGR
jgi:uncharacterized membrane protein